MELQWPLILFTTLVGASAGLFAAQGVYALAGRGAKAQAPALAASAILLVVGGVAVFLHLEHWERIFNGFGHLSSGITQELVAVIVMAAAMAAFFAVLRRGAGVPRWCAVLAIAASAALVLVMGLSYLMAARPAWNNALQVLSLFGLASAAGPGILAIFAKDPKDAGLNGGCALVGTVANAACTVAFALMMAGAVSQFVDVGYYFDPNHPTEAMVEASAFSPFSSGAVGLTAGAVALSLAAVAFAVYGKRSGSWKAAGSGVAICALAGAVLLRAAFFACGGSVFMFY
ncbi:hypothetical protein B5F40_11095 [Gordonibacter sp. An230]|uniref:DmsC/YnfH family molybdoenzyme membrane anchor subunit n=1 Tax=Gordonibacter sp. An230 TaxID=1965592 RepID=UPI000B39823E|nr:DmsC/YnfH family molybdoenzyme membrane anchor subunit [Gordonibacter sp. An230]OUO89424.1 hypothetical protein B5F40_11095 [Gordonibacter sp. An230]